jgi:hypothetical protein
VHPTYTQFTAKHSITDIDSRCVICDSVIQPSKKGLYGKTMADHLRVKHDMTREQYHVTYVFDGRRPTCSCPKCVTVDDPPEVSWHPTGTFLAFVTGHNRQKATSPPDVTSIDDHNTVTCLDCPVDNVRRFASNHALALHLKTHDTTFLDYVVRHGFGGVRPTCMIEGCHDVTRLDGERFKRFCLRHSRTAEVEGGKLGGSAPNPIKGKTKEDGILFLIERSQNYTGAGNHFFGKKHADETIEQMRIAKRLQRDEFVSRTTRKIEEYVVLSPYRQYESRQSPLLIRCQKCELEFQATLENLDRNCQRCPKCHPVCNGRSAGEEELADFVKSIVGPDSVVDNDRKVLGGLELDVYVPSKQFAVEYNGLYWHCELNSADDRMRVKLERARAANVRLMNVFEDEWLNRRDVVKSMIRARLGSFDSMFDARKCGVVELDHETAQQFMDVNHLDGSSKCSVRLGLVTQHTLQVVAVMTFGVPRQVGRWSHHIEVKRFATLQGTCVRGGIGKLSRAFMRSPEHNPRALDLMTYVHLRHGEGDGYEHAGFTRVGEVPLGFHWTTGGGRRLHRSRIVADRSRGMTERQVAAELGYHRIYDCGVAQFEMRRDT